MSTDTAKWITVSVRNTAGSWEVIDREACDGAPIPASHMEVSAQDIDGDVGQGILIELRDENDLVLESAETVIS